MKLPSLAATALFAAVERALQEIVNYDAATCHQLQQLSGKRVSVTLQPMNYHLMLTLGHPVRISQEILEKGDVHIEGAPGAFLRYLNGTYTTSGQALEIDGDIALAQRLATIASGMEIDWESWLEGLVGALPAHTLGQQARKLTGYLSDVSHHFWKDADEYIHHETESLPSRQELGLWLSGVDECRMAADRLEARIAALSVSESVVSESAASKSVKPNPGDAQSPTPDPSLSPDAS